MAENTGRRGGEGKKVERVPTKRKILKRERVIVLPETLDGDALDTTLKAVAKEIGMRIGSLKPTDAWVVVAENEALSETLAIEAHAGKPNTPDAKPGIWKAVSTRSWKGAVFYQVPPEPLVQKWLLDE